MSAGAHKDFASLPRLELWLCFAIWTGICFYSVYHVYMVSKDNSQIISPDFGEGWSFLGAKQDLSDNEWYHFRSYLYFFGPWLVGHILLGVIFHLLPSYWRYRWYAFMIYTMFSVSLSLGSFFIFYLLVQCFIMYLVCLTRRVWLVWIMGLVLLVNLNFPVFYPFLKLFISCQGHFYYLVLAISMLHLRLISYCLHVIEVEKEPHMLDIICYCFYLPGLILGPLITYDEFSVQIHKPIQPVPISSHLFMAFKLICYAIFMEFILHFWYFYSLQHHPYLLDSMSLWALGGVGFCNGQYFHVKYVIFYGLTILLMRIDQLHPPSTPKCISRIHLYSDMWKYFDRGLYNFLKKYIYLAFLGSSTNGFRKLFGSFLVFTYIYVWHGTLEFILVWCVLNFLGVVFEAIAKTIGNSPPVLSFRCRWLSPAMDRRLQALLASPLLLMSCISNFTFFGGTEVGKVFWKRFVFSGFPQPFLNACIVFYFVSQVSIEVTNWENKKDKQKAA